MNWAEHVENAIDNSSFKLDYNELLEQVHKTIDVLITKFKEAASKLGVDYFTADPWS